MNVNVVGVQYLNGGRGSYHGISQEIPRADMDKVEAAIQGGNDSELTRIFDFVLDKSEDRSSV